MMVHRGLRDTSKGPRWGHTRQVVVIAALLLALALPVGAQSGCAGVICSKNCDVNVPSDYMPQKCDRCCSHIDNGAAAEQNEVDGRMAAMEAAIKELRVMVGVILAVMVVLLLAVVAVLLRHTSARAFKAALPVFFRSKDEGRASIEKRPPPPNKLPNENRNSTVVRIADYQNNHSPLSKRTRPNGMAVHEDSPTEPNYPPPGKLPRTRQPSESTCPDESTDLPHAYDNLALSTSTLHDTTTSSTSTLGPAVSTNTLDTTLPSVNPTTPVLRQVSA